MQGTERTHKSATTAVFKQHTRQTSEVNKDSWAAEISGKISLVDKPLQTFFQEYVPCSSDFEGLRPWTDPAEVFTAVPSSGLEKEKYPELLNGLRKLVSSFDDVRRPKFADGSKCAVTFPFKDWEEEHHYTLPDILMSFPGERGENKTWAKTWHRIGMVCEVKNADDPINESAPWPSVKQGVTATAVLTQLAKSARNLMLTHSMLFVFVVGIYKNSARIYRFDRAACVVSKSFNIKTTPWPLHELLWRICHYDAPVSGLPGKGLVPRLLGEDPTFSPASEQDIDAADQRCKETGQRPLSEDERRACRWVTVTEYNAKGKVVRSTRILLYRIRSLNPRLFSRATVVWEGYEDKTWKRVAVKDAWRQVARDREDVFYAQIRGSMSHRSWRDLFEDYSELFGIAYMTYGDDLGARVVADSAARRNGDGQRSQLSPPLYDFYHRTNSSQRLQGAKADDPGYNERSHMRLVFETVGRPLSQFQSTKELIKALRDAIHGHRQAYLAGIIHRDISENNVMLSDDMMSFFFGFLLDLDYGFNWKEVLERAGWEVSEASWKRYVEEYDRSLPKRTRPAPPEMDIPLMAADDKDGSNDDPTARLRKAWLERMKMKERTGTLYFMAIEILATYVAHDVRHDLESFFWLLLWVVLRYTQTTCWPPNAVYTRVFAHYTEETSAMGKRYFLSMPMEWEVVGNAPLTTLVRKFKALCARAMAQYDLDTGALKNQGVALTYESVMALFDEALVSPEWPQGDRALPFKMPSKTATASQLGSQAVTDSRGEKRQAVDEPDPLSLPAHKRMHYYRRPDGPASDGDEQAANDA
ncbi:hypothetical protein C8Q72DRAFT_776846 [Fomitopsis betulina]|nr:hypothetical protein C8Q72DRAFT_776846 [Fomitopsis betulina]